MTRAELGIAVVMDHPAQHFVSAFQLLAAEPGLRVHVYYGSVSKRISDPGFATTLSWDIDLLECYPWSAPPSSRTAAWLTGELRAARPDVVLCFGWASPIARTAIGYCLLTRLPLLMYGDTTWQHASSGRNRLARSAALHVLLRRCAGAVSTGTFNREFYIRYGMDPRRIWPGVCPADTDTFAAARAERQPGTDGELRIGFAGKLVTRKGVDELLRAAALLPAERAWSVTVVGDGPMLPRLRALTAELGLIDRVVFRGFANTTEMPKVLAGFDVVVVPSRLDMRVLVTIEAMAAGAALIVSDATAVWGPGDLVEHGITGLVYRSGEPSMLAEQIKRLLGDPMLLHRLQYDGAQRSARFGPGAFAQTTRDAVREAVGRLAGANGLWAAASSAVTPCRLRRVHRMGRGRRGGAVAHGVIAEHPGDRRAEQEDCCRE